MFLDEAVIQCASGKGGDGAVTFHREKHVPRGGPNGAEGGKGGDIWLVADRSKRTLYDFKIHPHLKAPDGGNAQAQKHGSDAKDIEVFVPVGTSVYDAETGDLLADLSFEGARYRICRGGRGGHGNAHFVSSVRQAPKIAEKGEPGEQITARLELKLLADIGLIGLPNAGKSTLISAISAAKPKIADYPFTTLVPNLGVVSLGDESFTVADLPGLIEGAHEGHGLGDRFLKHAERTVALVHIVDVLPVDESDPLANFRLIENELKRYAEALHAKPRLIALNKIDLIGQEAIDGLKTAFENEGPPIFPISAATSRGLEPLLYAMVEALKSAPKAEAVAVITPLAERQGEETWDVSEEGDGYLVTGKRVQRWVAMTDMENDDSVRYLHKRLERIGVIERLREMGAEEGDNVTIGDWEFAFTDETT